MTDSIKLTTVTASIAALSITVTKPDGSSGALTIKNIDAIPEAVNPQDCPVLAPRAAGFVTDFVMTRDTMGADAAYKTVTYTLTYTFYYVPTLQGAGLFEKYDEMVTASAAVLLALSTNTYLSGTTDIYPNGIPQFGPVQDATGAQFHGCEISVRVTQYMET